ncbi:acidic mammalian chitinase-like [Aulostomus maculatus]
MGKLILIAGLCLIATSLASAFNVVCKYERNSRSRSGKMKFKISDISPSVHICSHLIYSSADVDKNFKLTPKWRDASKRYQSFNNLKNRNPDLKTLLEVDLITKSWRLSPAASSPKGRKTFIQSAISLLRNKKFDGLNLNWQSNKKKNLLTKKDFELLYKDLKEAFDAEATSSGQPRLLLTASVSAEKGVIDDSYDVTEIAKYLDFMNVLTFDLHRPEDGVTKHHSPLYQGSTDTGDAVYYNTDAAMKHWQSKGAHEQKLNLGVATFGRSFTLSNSAKNGVGAAVSGPGEQGYYTEKSGLLAYYEICSFCKKAAVTMIADQKVPYATKSDQWIGFDDKGSIDAKVNYVKLNNFGGVFVSSLDQDDFEGVCGHGKYPLLRHLHGVLIPGSPESPCLGLSNEPHTNPNDPTSFYNCWEDRTYIQYCQTNPPLVYDDSCKCCNWP